MVLRCNRLALDCCESALMWSLRGFVWFFSTDCDLFYHMSMNVSWYMYLAISVGKFCCSA